MGSKSIHGRARYPQSQGQVERMNKTLKEQLRKKIQDENSSAHWPTLLEIIVQEFNNNPPRKDMLSPIQLMRPMVSSGLSVGQQALVQAQQQLNSKKAVNMMKSRYKRNQNMKNLKKNVRKLELGENVLICRKNRNKKTTTSPIWEYEGKVMNQLPKGEYNVNFLNDGPNNIKKGDVVKWPGRLLKRIPEGNKNSNNSQKEFHENEKEYIVNEYQNDVEKENGDEGSNEKGK